MFGPVLPFVSWPSAAVQLHQTCHSCIALHHKRVLAHLSQRLVAADTTLFIGKLVVQAKMVKTDI
jgi:hypothetical protein